MYRSKEQGRARHELFDEVMRARAVNRRSVENNLRRAIERNELRVAYQPIVSLREDGLVGVEALLRWQPTESSVVPPRDFISVAEENGLIEPIGSWVLEQACTQAARWSQVRDRAGPPPWVAVNLSAVQVAELGRIGCELAQGYWFGRPGDAEAILRRIRSSRGSLARA